MDKQKMISFVNLRTVNPIMDWNDIKVGEIYHLPPLIYNKRMDFVVIEKSDNIIKINRLGDDYNQTMFRTDITSRFIVKKWDLYAKT